MNSPRRNWALWLGFLLCLAGFASYFPLSRFPVTRDVPWVNFLLFAVGLVFLVIGLRRAYGMPGQFRGKVLGPVLSLLSLLLAGTFCFVVFYLTKQVPKSASAPRVGEKAPEFALLDTNHQNASLAGLLAAPMPDSPKPPKGLLLVFYRGYW